MDRRSLSSRSLSTQWTFANKFIIPVLHVLATDVLAVVLYVDGVWPAAQAALRGYLSNRWVEGAFWLI